jgi:hypothetical protein
MDALKNHRDREGELRRHIFHHDIALLDEQYLYRNAESTW